MITRDDLGKRVICTWDGDRHGEFNPYNKRGRVAGVTREVPPHFTVYITWDCPDFNKHWESSTWFPSSFKLVDDLLDVSRPVKCRDARYKVEAYAFHKDKIAANVVLPDGRALSLNYSLHGHFYEGFEQPLDLVNS